MKRRGIAALLAAAVVVACGHQGAQSHGAATTTGLLPAGVPTEGSRPPAATLPPAAEPQNATPPIGTPPGRVVPVAGHPEGVAVDAVTRIVAVATHDPDQLVLLNADSLGISDQIPLPGSARHVELAAPGGPVLVPVPSRNPTDLNGAEPVQRGGGFADRTPHRRGASPRA